MASQGGGGAKPATEEELTRRRGPLLWNEEGRAGNTERVLFFFGRVDQG